ncbi:MAG: S41 family peptidase [Chitinophagaceae bacterium]
MISCTCTKLKNYQFNQKTSAAALQQDLILLQQILASKHPSLYWYTPKDSIDALFNNAINSITDSLTEVAFRNKVAYILSHIRCGHTSISFSKNYTKALPKNRFPQFPLAIKTWEDTMVVLGNYWPTDSLLKRGTIIRHINGKSAKTILDSIFRLISTDGYSNNYKSQVISGSFFRWYELAWGKDSVYTFTYIDKNGQSASTNIKAFIPVKDTVTKKATTQKTIEKPSRKAIKQSKLLSKRSLQIDSTNRTAYMRVATFSNIRLNKFFRNSFKTLTEQNIQNLIIDIRENTGGRLSNSIVLTKYLIDKPFKTTDSAYAINRSLQYSKYIPSLIWYWFPMNFLNKKGKDGYFHFTNNENKWYTPKQKYHYNKQIYIIQGGYTFSAATMFAGNLFNQQNVTIVGEESGGGFYGNSALYLPTIVLPNSKLTVTLPLYRLVMNSNRPKDGRGIIPNMHIKPNIQAITKGIDLKLDSIQKQIKIQPVIHLP